MIAHETLELDLIKIFTILTKEFEGLPTSDFEKFRNKEKFEKMKKDIEKIHTDINDRDIKKDRLLAKSRSFYNGNLNNSKEWFLYIKNFNNKFIRIAKLNYPILLLLENLYDYMSNRNILNYPVDYKLPVNNNNIIKYKIDASINTENLIKSYSDFNIYKSKAYDREKVNHYKPARLSSPLFPLDNRIVKIYQHILIDPTVKLLNFSTLRNNILENILSHIYLVDKALGILRRNGLNYSDTMGSSDLKYTMDDLTDLYTCDKMPHSYEIDNMIEFTTKLMDIDYRTINNNEKLLINMNPCIDRNLRLKIPVILKMMIKLRHTLHSYNLTDINQSPITMPKDDIQILVFKQGLQLCMSNRDGILYLNSDGFCTIIDMKNNDTYLLDNQHMDYIITAIETIINLKSVVLMNEFEYLNDIFEIVMEIISDKQISYNTKVDFFKNMETLCLMKADINDNLLINWEPIIDVLGNIKFIHKASDLRLMFFSYIGIYHNKFNKFSAILYKLNKLDGDKLLELSSIHKLIYYSEINEQKGIDKYLKRTHTPRNLDNESIKSADNLFKKLFIKSYYIRHNKLPNFTIDDNKFNLIKSTLSTNKLDYDSLPSSFFNELIFKKTFETLLNKDPLLNAKDKSCSKKDVKFSSKDGTPELMEILSRSNYKMSNHFKDIHVKDNFIYTGYFKEKMTDVCLDIPVRLCMKEREQKEEGRLFGCATLEYKHELSYYNDHINQIVKYFDGQFINIANHEKKSKMHHAAQLLLNKNNYSLMLDIEGHNQSIQPENVKGLLKMFNDLFGIREFGNLINYFSKLDVYYNYQFENKTMYSHGQKGGIEGWMNPFWTLITLLYTEMIKERTSLNVIDIMLYSDDVNIIFRSDDLRQDNINKIYNEVVMHYKSFGFTVKASQTIISKNRSTLLRNHFFKGKFADTCLKKILSISAITENLFANEMIDSSTLNSSINSALEYSNRFKTQLFIKYFKLTLINLKTFINYLVLNPNDSTLKVLYCDNIKALNHFDRHFYQNFLNLNDKIEQQRILDLLKKDFPLAHITQMIDPRYYAMNKYSDYIRALKDNNELMFCFYIRLILPENSCGYNVSTLSNSLLSGGSNTTRKFDDLIYALKGFINSHNNKIHIAKIIFSRLNLDFNKLDSETSVLNEEYPVFKQFNSTSNLLKVEILKKIKQVNKNTDFELYISSDRQVEKYELELIKLLKKNFNFRLASIYKENSIFMIAEMLYSKLETSKSFVKRLNLPSMLFRELYLINTLTIREVFRKESDLEESIIKELLNNEIDVVEIFANIRKNTYPNINFILINEPVLNNRLQLSTDQASLFTISKGSHLSFKEDHYEYKHMKVPKGVKIKYRENELIREEIPIEYRLILKNLYITKWLLFNDNTLVNIETINYVKICNLNLSAFTKYRYNDLKDLVNIPTGGEILHRIDNVNFKDKSYIKTLQQLALSYNIANFYSTNSKELPDSNINFNFAKSILILRSAAKEYNTGLTTVRDSFGFSNYVQIVEDVKIKFGYEELSNVMDLEMGRKYALKLIDIELIKIYDKFENTGFIDILTDNNNTLEKKIQSDIISFYQELTDQQLWYDFKVSPDRLWRRLKTQMDYNYNTISRMSLESFITYAEELIKSYFNEVRNIKGINLNLIYNILKFDNNDTLIHDAAEKLTTSLQTLAFKIRKFKDGTTEYTAIKRKIHNKYLRVIDEVKKEFFRKLVLDILIKHCLCFEYNSRKYLRLMINRTCVVLDSLINGNLLQLHQTNSYVLVNLLGKEEFSKYLAEDSIYIKSKLSEMNRKIIFDSPEIVKNYSIKLINERKCTDIPEIIVNNIIYNDYVMDSNAVKYCLQLFLLAKTNKDHCIVNSDPNSFYSLTGSDSLTALIGISKYIVRESCINNKVYNVCDLTAGRGDGHLAMSKIGLMHTSFARKDLFTDTCKLEGIIDNLTYDITDSDTLNFINNYNIILIDISFIKGKVEELYNTLNNLIYMHKKEIIIRINSLNPYSLAKFIQSNSTNNTFKLLIPNYKNYKPYHIYLHVKPDIPTLTSLKDYSDTSINFMKTLIYNQITNIDLTPMINNCLNSSNFRIRLSNNNLLSILDNFEQFLSNEELFRDVDLLIQYFNNYEIVVLQSSYAKYFNNRHIDNNNKYNNFLRNIEADFIMSNEDKLRLKSHYEQSQTKYQNFSIYDLSFNEIENVSNKSPLKLFNRLLQVYKSCFIRKHTEDNNDRIDYSYIENFHSNINIEEDKIVEMGRSGYETIILILQAAFNESYSLVLKELIYLYRISYHKGLYKTKFLRLIKNVKFCSNLIDEARDIYGPTITEKCRLNNIYHKLLEREHIKENNKIKKREEKVKIDTNYMVNSDRQEMNWESLGECFGLFITDPDLISQEFKEDIGELKIFEDTAVITISNFAPLSNFISDLFPHAANDNDYDDDEYIDSDGYNEESNEEEVDYYRSLHNPNFRENTPRIENNKDPPKNDEEDINDDYEI